MKGNWQEMVQRLRARKIVDAARGYTRGPTEDEVAAADMIEMTNAAVTKERIRDILRANMFDGHDGGMTTMKVSTLLDDASEILAEHLGRTP